MSQIEAAKSADIVEGAIFAATLGGKPVGLTRVKGKVEAFLNKCPHLGMKLTNGKIEQETITCPFHGSRFNLCTGQDTAWVNGFMGIPLPSFLHNVIAMGKKPQGLTKIAATERDGTVFIEL